MEGGVTMSKDKEKVEVEDIKLDESNIDINVEDVQAPAVEEVIETEKVEETDPVVEMPKVRLLSEMSFDELKAICEDKKITIGKKDKSKKALISLIEKSTAEVITLDNKPVSPVITANIREEIPANFVQLPKQKSNNGLKAINGRFYTDLKNGYGMWCDNGKMFNVSDYK